MKLVDLKKKYKNKWVLGEVLKEGRLQEVLEVKPLVVNKNRDTVYKSLSKLKKGSHAAIIYTGQIPPRGMTYTLYA